MAQISFIIIILILFQNNQANFSNNFHNTFDNCAIYSHNFWFIYARHFILANSIKILILQTNDHKFVLNQLTKALFQQMNRFDSKYLPIKIEEKILNEYNRSRELSDYRKLTSTETEEIVLVNDENELIRIKRQSSDSLDGYVIIVWDVASLKNFLEENFTDVIPEARATYAFIFAFSTYDNCERVDDELDYILRHLWIEHNVVNAIAQTLCFCNSNQIYIYRPFVRIDNSWGFTQNYPMEKIVDNLGLITTPLKDLNELSLKVSLFIKNPTVIRTLPKLLRKNPIYENLNYSKGLGGLDGLILNTLAKHLNFDIEIVENNDTFRYGRVWPNGTATGTLGDVVERRALFSGNGRFLADYGTDKIEFTVPYSADKICIVVPKAMKVPRWRTFFNSFDSLSWSLIILIVVICTIFWQCINPSKIDSKASWEMLSYLMGIPYRVIPTNSQFVFLTTCMFFNIIILGIVQGSLFTELTTTTYFPDINTLEDVAKSEMPVAGHFWYLVKDNSDTIKKLKRRRVDFIENIFDFVAYQRNVVVVDRKLDLDILIKTKYLGPDGLPLLYIVNECITSFLIVNIVPKGSPFLTVFNHIIIKLFESGLTSKWYNDVADSTIIEALVKQKRHDEFESFSLYDMQAAFFIFLVGHTCSCVVFVYEIIANSKWCKSD